MCHRFQVGLGPCGTSVTASVSLKDSDGAQSGGVLVRGRVGGTRGGHRQGCQEGREQLMKGLSYAGLRGSDFILKAVATFRARQWPHQICIFKRQFCWQCQGRDYRAARPGWESD